MRKGLLFIALIWTVALARTLAPGHGQLGSCTAIPPGPVALVDDGDGTVADHATKLT
jgi:hypothetical protein